VAVVEAVEVITVPVEAVAGPAPTTPVPSLVPVARVETESVLSQRISERGVKDDLSTA
jgi:hypothetical protein